MASEALISVIIVDENNLQLGGLRSCLEAEADIVVVGDFRTLEMRSASRVSSTPPWSF